MKTPKQPRKKLKMFMKKPKQLRKNLRCLWKSTGTHATYAKA
jgi:hypothetical protein